jgi:hypothetical protein
MASQAYSSGRGNEERQSYAPPVAASSFITQSADVAAAGPEAAAAFRPQHFPYQELPPPKDPPPFRYDLSRFLTPADVSAIQNAGVMVMQTVGDTGDGRGRQQDFVAGMMKADADASPRDRKPAFLYHLGDVVYFAGDIDKYGDNFYETYKDYPAFIVAISGNHDCQPDDPQDGPVDPNKFPFDGWVKNFMSATPSQLGSLKTGSNRTQIDLPNVYWTLTTPVATILGLCSNVSETEGEMHQDQIDWFRGELTAADTGLALIVAVHHPPFSGDVEHVGSSKIYTSMFDSFAATDRYPDLILSGHVHNYQRFTHVVDGGNGPLQVPCVVAGAGGYTRLGRLQKINGAFPQTPLVVNDKLTLENYDHDNFGFLRLEVSKTKILGTYFSQPFVSGAAPNPTAVESFSITVGSHVVQTVPG